MFSQLVPNKNTKAHESRKESKFNEMFREEKVSKKVWNLMNFINVESVMICLETIFLKVITLILKLKNRKLE